ncbi:glycosyltransferase [Mangrovimonas xylaniphaga]|uniref:glycosyltransferase n=1 Tax=Mangrovimonas xylaniphaga TaxID=1645915 RepID=UPI0006B47B6B|nr:glycosyltransferase [Mangrovimonas xylaniphaga]
MKLAIISHTEHYIREDGVLVGLGSTVTEINHLLSVFDEIIHVAMLHSGDAPANALPYVSDRIRFQPISAVGGPGFIDKLAVLKEGPKVLRTVSKALRRSDVFQFRAPTGIGVFVIPYLMWFVSKPGWFKYAGNWHPNRAPIAYAFQKWLLEHQDRKVTINGQWPEQAKHCLTFENPCLTKEEIEEGEQVTKLRSKTSDGLHFCFVGRLEAEKGISLLLEAFCLLNENEQSHIASIHVVGIGKQQGFYEVKAKESDLPIKFYGHLSRADVHAIYQSSHAIVLPSASEGFPKVVAEAMNYGCLPIVSDVSAISQYVMHGQNGFLLESLDAEGVAVGIRNLICLTNEDYQKMVIFTRERIERFSYHHYNTRLKEVLEVSKHDSIGDWMK